MHENVTNFAFVTSQPNFWYESKLVLNGVTYGEDKLLSMSTNQSLFADDSPMVGCAVAAELDVEMLMPTATIPRMAEMRPYVRASAIVGGATVSSDWIPKGVFYIDTREQSHNDGGTDTLKLHGYDAMLKTEQPNIKVGDSAAIASYPKTMPTVVNDICTAIGVQWWKGAGRTIYWNQLISNGNFAQVFPWAAGAGGMVTVSGHTGISIATASGTVGIMRDDMPTTIGHVYYLKAQYKGKDTLCMNFAGINGVIATDLPNYRFNDIRYRWTASTPAAGNYFILFSIVDSGNIQYYKNICLFDLTAMFGAGNEPTAEEFEEMFPDPYYEYNAGQTEYMLEGILPYEVQMTGVGEGAMTMREVLQGIASAHCGNFIMDDYGHLKLIGLKSVGEDTSYLVDNSLLPITFGGVRIIV